LGEWGGWEEKTTHYTVRHSFRAAFSSLHFITIRKPVVLQQWLNAGGGDERERERKR